tara:strand:+ start:940 stop:2856 length:1917 start_codon:yes stop_codon:yes gene_type:complete
MEEPATLQTKLNEFHAIVQVAAKDVDLLETVVGSRLKNMDLTPEIIIDAIVSMCTRSYSESLTGKAIKILAPYHSKDGYISYSDLETERRKTYLAAVRSAFFTFATACASFISNVQSAPPPLLWNPCTARCLSQWENIFAADSDKLLTQTVASIIHPVYMQHYGVNYDSAERVYGEDATKIQNGIIYPVTMIVMSYMRPCSHFMRIYGEARCTKMITGLDYTYPDLDLIPFSESERRLVADLPMLKNSIPATSSDLFLLYGGISSSPFLSAESTKAKAKLFAEHVFENVGNLGLLYSDFCAAILDSDLAEMADLESAESPDFCLLRTLFCPEADGYATLGAMTASTEDDDAHENANGQELVAARQVSKKRKQPTANVSFADVSKRREWELVSEDENESKVPDAKRIKFVDTHQQVPAVEHQPVLSNPEKCAARFSVYLARCREVLLEFQKIVPYQTAANRPADMDIIFASSIERFEEMWKLAGAWKYRSAEWLHQELPKENTEKSAMYSIITPQRDEIKKDVGNTNLLESTLQLEAVTFAQVAMKIQGLPCALLKHVLGVFFLLLKASKTTKATIRASNISVEPIQEDEQGKETFKLDRWKSFRAALEKHHILGQCYVFNMEVQSMLFQCTRMSATSL